uniref:Uncharacterized protein n=1 Tax=Kwoniella dejecticola CBS 10117 TaxID=1296121 RepID=A0A1A6A9K3_9TREE|nr:uncharacterized protein I303_02761 [Kwoniella dejecticola CBS 10117]OBR86747.1 hypothetical protein I303_02761 [Kwoniella dejecticola CBS 10117]
MRSLKLDDIAGCWEGFDKAIWGALDRIRGIRVPRGVKRRDRRLLALPAKMGGLGLYSYQHDAPLAYTAASSLSVRMLRPLVEGLDQEDNTRSQSQLTQAAYQEESKELLNELPLHDRITMAESASTLGRRWLSAIPSHSRFTMSDNSIQANLAYRTLVSGYDRQCRKCALPNKAGHDEWCMGRRDYRVARHESVKHQLSSGLKAIPLSTVTVEPFIAHHMRRNDIRITLEGDGRPVIREEYDLKVVSLSAPSHQQNLRANGWTSEEKREVARDMEEKKYMEDAGRRIRRVLKQQARRKVTNLPEGDRAPFVPLVISTGGYMEQEMEDKIREWRRWEMPGIAYTWMLTSVSVALARARGRTFLGEK